MFVLCECCVLSGRGLCDELITRPEESYRLRCVVVCDLENLKNEETKTRVGSQLHSKKKISRIGHFFKLHQVYSPAYMFVKCFCFLKLNWLICKSFGVNYITLTIVVENVCTFCEMSLFSHSVYVI